MKLSEITSWLNKALNITSFSDVSNNGLQIDREGDEITSVAFGVDASVNFIKRASLLGAQLCVVHHGISWGGGIRTLTGNDYCVVKASMSENIALYGVHLPLDASSLCGNNWEIARYLSLANIEPAFSYHGCIIGVTGKATETREVKLGTQILHLQEGQKIGVCSGGAGEFACEAKKLGCHLYVTGEASWADQVAAKNVGASLVCCGHYETEIFGVSALSREMQKALPVKCEFILE